MTDTTPQFDGKFRDQLRELLAWRRDVRRFRPDPVSASVLAELLDLACLAPSVGNSQPWRFVAVDETARRLRVRDNFLRCNQEALGEYQGPRAALYARLKLSGLAESPVQLAVFVDETTPAGHGLGRQTMPESLHYSAVAAVHTLWLVARAYSLGVGWVSILDPGEIARILDVPNGWSRTCASDTLKKSTWILNLTVSAGNLATRRVERSYIDRRIWIRM